VVMLLLMVVLVEAGAESKPAFVKCGQTSKCLSSRQHSTCSKVLTCHGLPTIEI
jgi:hypothetical protein